MSRIFHILLALLISGQALAEVGKETKSPFGRKGTFYLGILAPYPATFGLGLTHFFIENIGTSIELGKGASVIYTAGIKLRPSSAKVSPIVGINASLVEDIPGSPHGVFYANTGFDWKWDNGMFLHFGANWSLTKKDDVTEMKPYLQFGIAY